MLYTTYTAEDFATDESFQAAVLATDAAAATFWQAWLRQHPSKEPEFRQAEQLLRLLAASQPAAVPATLKHAELQRLLTTLRPTAPRPWLLRSRRSRVWRAVAVPGVALLLGAGYWFSPLHDSKPAELVRYTTPYGEQREIRLPDGSQVILNANSTLETAAHWNHGESREVWLKGEAFFSVTHTAPAAVRTFADAPAGAKFRVHAGDVDVTVLGTKFNVNNRTDRTTVVLNSGKIQLDRRGWLQHEQVLLKPGQLVKTAPETRELTPETVDAAGYSSWTDGHLTFNHSTVAEIIQLLRHTYDLHVTVADSALLRQELTGSVPSNNVDVLLTALAKSLHVDMVRKGNQVHFRPAGR